MAAPALPNPTSQDTIADMVRSARERKGLSQNQAFQQCNVSRLTYRMWEKGTWEQIRLRYVPTLARFCDTTEEDILEHMGVLTHDAAEALRRARKRGTVQGVVNEHGLTGWETGRYLQWGLLLRASLCDPSFSMIN